MLFLKNTYHWETFVKSFIHCIFMLIYLFLIFKNTLQKVKFHNSIGSWTDYFPSIIDSYTYRIFVFVTSLYYSFLHVIINCSGRVLPTEKYIQNECKYLNNILKSKNRLTGEFVVIVIGYKIHNCITFWINWTDWSDRNSVLPACLLKPKDVFIRNETSALSISYYSDQWSGDERIK